MQNRISQVTGRLPNEVNAVGISVTRVSSNFVLAAGAFAENGEYDIAFVSNYVDRFIRDELKRVPGVGDIFVFGERRYAMRLWLDPDRLAGRSVTADEVVAALREQNVQVAAGQVGAPPQRSGQTYQISVRAEGRLVEPSQFDDIIVKRAADGGLVRVRDVGRTELGAESYSQTARYNGRDAHRLRRAAVADRQLAAGVPRRAGDARPAVAALSAGAEGRNRLRHDHRRRPNRSARS